MLEGDHIGHVKFTAGRQDLAATGPAIRICPGVTDRIKKFKIRRRVVTVGSFNETTLGIQIIRFGFDRQIAIPFVATVAGYWHHPAEISSNRRNAHCLPSDIAFTIRPNHILAGNVAVV